MRASLLFVFYSVSNDQTQMHLRYHGCLLLSSYFRINIQRIQPCIYIYIYIYMYIYANKK